MNITIKMRTGNAAFLTRRDVAKVLKKVADKFQSSKSWNDLPEKILDDNGNTVGTLEVPLVPNDHE